MNAGANILAWMKIIGVLLVVILLGVLVYYIQKYLRIGAKASTNFIVGKDGEHNVASRATDAVLQSSGVISKDDSLGTAIYNFFNGDENLSEQAKLDAKMKAQTDDKTDNSLPIGNTFMLGGGA